MTHPRPFQEWYSRVDVRDKLCSRLRNRELTFMCRDCPDASRHLVHRGLKAGQPSYLQTLFDTLDHLKHSYELFESVAHYNLRDKWWWCAYTRNRVERTKHQNRFLAEHAEHAHSYQNIIDVDHKDLDYAHALTVNLADYLRAEGRDHTVTFSGRKGFHVRWAPWSHQTIKQVREDAKNIALDSGTPTTQRGQPHGVDDSIYQTNRIIRLPYSIHAHTGLVAKTLTKQELDSFNANDLDWLKPENVII